MLAMRTIEPLAKPLGTSHDRLGQTGGLIVTAPEREGAGGLDRRAASAYLCASKQRASMGLYMG